MAVELFANNASTILSGNGGSISAGATTFNLLSAAQFPISGNFRVRIGLELILVTGISGNTITSCTRQIENTTAVSHNDGDEVEHIVTAAGLVQAMDERDNVWKFWDGIIITVADQDVPSNTTVADDNGLRFDMVAGKLYIWDTYLIYSSPVGAGTPDIKIGVAGPAALTYGYEVHGEGSVTTGDVAASIVNRFSGAGQVDTSGTAVTPRSEHWAGWAYSTGGGVGASGFRIQWAQNTSNANPTRRLAGSVMRYRKMQP
jgi:hypothetical protein